MSGGRGLDLSVLRTLYRYELKMLLRDKRTIMIAVVAPLLIFPILILVMKTADRREQRELEATVFRYAVTGSEAERARALLAEALTLPADTGDGGRIRPVDAVEMREEDPDSTLREGGLHVVVEALSAEEWRAEREERLREQAAEARDAAGDSVVTARGGMAAERAARAARELARDTASVPVLRLRYRESSDRSEEAASRLRERLEVVRDRRRDVALAERGFPVEPARVLEVHAENVASAERVGGAMLGLFLTPLLVMLMLSGGSIVAVDAIAGEKERGTLENLLTTAARRGEIVASKQLAVITVGLAITVITAAELLFYLTIGILDLPEALSGFRLAPAGVVALLLLFLPVVVLVSSALLLLSGYSKSFKEFQIYFFPLFLVFLVPCLAAVLPGMELRSAVVVVPLANVSVAVREVLVGEYDWLFLALAFLVTTGAAVWLASVTSRLLSTERLITASELERADLEGGAALFPRHVLRWFAVLWAVLLTASAWLGGELGIRGQVVVNLVGIFLGGTLLMLWRYRLPVREALALRAPHPAVWLAVLVGAPSALLTGIGVAQLLDYVIPVPEEMLEAFGQFMLPENVPFWQVLFFLAVLPGICEELAFRGVLVHGLRRRMSPVMVAVVSGLIFGAFHVSLFRIGPTAYLGVMLAAVVLLSGSIYPAMLWHALNNAIALGLGASGRWGGEPAPPWAYGAAAVGLAVAFWILWRTRRPLGDGRVRRGVEASSVAEAVTARG